MNADLRILTISAIVLKFKILITSFFVITQN